MKYAQNNSTFVDDITLSYPFSVRGRPTADEEWGGFDFYCQNLEDEGYFWESLTVLKILGPVQPQTWGKKNYTRLIQRISSVAPTVHSILCLTASELAYGRFLISKGSVQDGVRHLSLARALLSSNQIQPIGLSQPVDYAGTRQALELDLGEAESLGDGSNYEVQLRSWREIARKSRQQSEYGIESYCYTNYAQIAAKAKDYQQLRRFQTRLEEIENEIEGDIPSLLSNKCGQWRAEYQEDFGIMLAWFQAFDSKFPLSSFLLEDSSHSENTDGWDLPSERYREEHIKYSYFLMLGHQEYARDCLQRASRIARFVPRKLATRLDMDKIWNFEWEDPITSAYIPVEAVLANRFKASLGDANDDIAAHSIREILDIRNLRAEEVPHMTLDITPEVVKKQLFVTPVNEQDFNDKLGIIQRWFDGSTIFNQSASLLILALLKLDFVMHVAISQGPEFISRLSLDFVHFVDNLPNPELRVFLARNSLLERQRASDVYLFWYSASLPDYRLRDLRREYAAILEFYELSNLSKEFGKVATLNARLGEVELLLHEGDNYLTLFKEYQDKAEDLFNGMRIQLNALGASMSLQLKSSIRGALLGHQHVLNRAISCLTAEYKRVSDKRDQNDKAAFMLWDFIQRGKGRALMDQLSSSHLLSIESVPRRSPPRTELETGKFYPVVQLEKELREQQEADGFDKSSQDQTADLGPETKAEHEENAPKLLEISRTERLDLKNLLLKRMGADWQPNTNELQVSELIRNWQAKSNHLAEQKFREKPDPSAIQKAYEDVRLAELDMRECGEAAAITKILSGDAVNSAELIETVKHEGRGVVFVDWFATDIPGVSRALHMIIFRAAPEARSPVLFRLTRGIGPKTDRWVQEYLGADSTKLFEQSAYHHLQELEALVSPLAGLTEPGEILVFCPTNVWNVHRVPLHALELPIASSSISNQTHAAVISPTDAQPEDEANRNILVVRNRIVYTYSQSLLYINSLARQNRGSIRSDDWRASVLSPLSQTPPEPHALPLKGAFPPIMTTTIDRNLTRFAVFFNSPITRAAQVSDDFIVQQTANVDLFYFLGHIHPHSGALTNPLAQHMMLYHPQVNPDCLSGAVHEPGSSLSAESVLVNCRMRQGSHAIILGCGSGITEYPTAGEPLGLVSAFLCSGASSIVSTLSDVLADDACWWTRSYQAAWEGEEKRVRESGAAAAPQGSIDLASCCQDAVIYLIRRRGKTSLMRWASFVHYGYWRFPSREN